MRRVLSFLLALVLGAGCAVLVACGDGGTKDGLPQASADKLSSDFEDVQQAVDSARCTDVIDQLAQIDRRLDGLPESVDAKLADRLRQAQDNLRARAGTECQENAKPDETDTPADTQTQTQETTTTTVPPETTPETVPEQTIPEETIPPEPDPGLPPETPPQDQDTLPQGGGAEPVIP